MILISLLVVHGIICVGGAFFPFYPPVFLFYWFFPGTFAMKLIIVLVAGAAQVVFGVYLLLKKKGWRKVVLARYCGCCSRVASVSLSYP